MKSRFYVKKILQEPTKVNSDDTQFPNERKAQDTLAKIAKALGPQNKSITLTTAASNASATQARLMIDKDKLKPKKTNIILLLTPPTTDKTLLLVPSNFFIDEAKISFLRLAEINKDDFVGIDDLFNPEANISTIRINLPHQKIEAYARMSNASEESQGLDYEEFAAINALERSLEVFARVDDGTDEGSTFARWGIDQFRKLQEHHKQTVIHSYSVYELTLAFCEFLKLDKKLSQRIANAALPHDIGKLKVDRAVLKKRGNLSNNDWEQVKSHPTEGFKIAKDNYVSPKVAELPVILWHHKSSDGNSGYPEGNPELTLGTEIVHVVDVYNALTGFREYRESVDPRIALKLILRGKGKDFNPYIVDRFCEFLGFDPKKLEREIEVDKKILRALNQGSGTVFNPEVVAQLMRKNEYRLNDLK